MQRHAELRRAGGIGWLRPDAKAQVTVRYAGITPVAVEKVVLSTQHAPGTSHEVIEDAMRRQVIEPVIPEGLRSPHLDYIINPSGEFSRGARRRMLGLPDAR